MCSSDRIQDVHGNELFPHAGEGLNRSTQHVRASCSHFCIEEMGSTCFLLWMFLINALTRCSPALLVDQIMFLAATLPGRLAHHLQV